MRLLLAYELGLAGTITWALLAVLVGGRLPVVFWLCLMAPWSAASFGAKPGMRVPGFAGTLLALTSVIGAGTTILQGGTSQVLTASTFALMGVLLARLWTRQDVFHDLQAILLSLLLVFAASALNLGISFGLIFVAYSMFVVWTLIARGFIAGAHRESERKGGAPLETTLRRRDITTPAFFASTAAISAALLLSTGLLFAIFPRVGLGRLGFLSPRQGALPQNVSLDGPPRVSAANDSVVARVFGLDLAEFQNGLYLRGPAYDVLTKTGFKDSGAFLRSGPPATGRDTKRYEIFLQPVTDQQLLALGPVRRARVLAGGGGNPSAPTRIEHIQDDGTIRLNKPLTGPIRYRVESGFVSPRATRVVKTGYGLHPVAREHYLALPDDISPTVVELGKELVQDESEIPEIANTLIAHFRSGFTYTLTQPNAAKSDPLESFLFEDRRGHCEYYATALATLLRAAGVPSRVVGGYMGGSFDPQGQVVVFTGQHAHVWVEWYLDGVGWMTADATPAGDAPPSILEGLAATMERIQRAWDDYVVDYGLREQIEGLSAIGEAIGSVGQEIKTPQTIRLRTIAFLLAPIALAALAFWLLRRRASVARRSHLALAIEEAFERLGQPVAESQTFREAARDVHGPALVALRDAITCYELLRFAARSVPGARVAASVRALKSVGV